MNLKEEVRARGARLEPSLHFTSFSVPDLLMSVRERHFPGVGRRLTFHFVRRGCLCSIVITEDEAAICAHDLLNHSDTPVEVISYVCKHELLHLEVAPRRAGRRWTSHPPEFWEREKSVAPERSDAWGWILINLGTYLKKRPRLERIDVRGGWKRNWLSPRLSLEGCREICPLPPRLPASVEAT